MPDREKVIRGLECVIRKMEGGVHVCDDCPYDEDFNCLGCDIALRQTVELLREQEAIKPREQEETRTWTVCGNCSQHLISKWLWCPYCGRAVKWDG